MSGVPAGGGELRDRIAGCIENQAALLTTGSDQQDWFRAREIADALVAGPLATLIPLAEFIAASAHDDTPADTDDGPGVAARIAAEYQRVVADNTRLHETVNLLQDLLQEASGVPASEHQERRLDAMASQVEQVVAERDAAVAANAAGISPTAPKPPHAWTWRCRGDCHCGADTLPDPHDCGTAGCHHAAPTKEDTEP